MLQFFLNPWMLTGLLGISLPIIAHLLSRRRFDVVEWGAMQFLNPSRKTRRRLRLEEILLLLLRIGLVTAIVLAATRPWIPGGWLSAYRSSGSRAVVLIIDGSNSMSRTDGVNTLHLRAIRRATEFLQSLGSDDSVAVIDARDQPIALVPSPLSDLQTVTAELSKIPSPAGACAILPALEKAIGILGRSSAATREIVVFSDQQGNNWHTQQEADWKRFDELLQLPAVRPRVWMVDVSSQSAPVRRNLAVGKVTISRETTVPGFPVRIRTDIRNSSDTEASVPVRLLLDGQPLAGQQQQTSIAANSETRVEFEYTLRTAGSHVLSIEAAPTDDAWTIDNTRHVAVKVEPSLPVLLINGSSTSVASDQDTYFSQLAFSSIEDGTPWVTTRVLDAAEVQPADFSSVSAVICCNVARLSPAASSALADFVARGNGLIIACGPATTAESFDACFVQSGLMTPLQVVRNRDAAPQAAELVHVAPLSIQPGWLERFRSDPSRSFLKATFQRWTVFRSGPASAAPPVSVTAAGPNASAQSAAGNPPATPAPGTSAASPQSSPPVVLAQLTSGDPLLMELRHGKGCALLLTSTLNRLWNDLPTRADFVPFLHEAIFHTTSVRNSRNVMAGESLVMTAPWPPESAKRQRSESATSDTAQMNNDSPPSGLQPSLRFRFVTPDGQVREPESNDDNSLPTGILPGPVIPGIYKGTVFSEDDNALAEQSFVVNYDPSEDQYKPLTPDDQARLTTNDRVRFTDSLEELRKRMYGKESMTELWAALINIFLLFLVAELLLTRRIILRGHGADSAVPDSTPPV